MNGIAVTLIWYAAAWPGIVWMVAANRRWVRRKYPTWMGPPHHWGSVNVMEGVGLCILAIPGPLILLPCCTTALLFEIAGREKQKHFGGGIVWPRKP